MFVITSFKYDVNLLTAEGLRLFVWAVCRTHQHYLLAETELSGSVHIVLLDL